MISLFNKLDEHNYLLMVGTGALLEQTKQQINLLGLQNRVKIIERIPNKDIWELYCLSDVFVNLNYTEIWGMVLLEAMYYRPGLLLLMHLAHRILFWIIDMECWLNLTMKF